ncbi:permease [Cytobacillus gottheilii]|uniref:Permease n=1 Tax=Cytobacillus gottheilii TaxID=859144 RepID=A0ABX8FEG8_9BACI|nr:permease [Cytobacillus gottheilii]QVY62405.1 permease [Cytobacillus gottheilii]
MMGSRKTFLVMGILFTLMGGFVGYAGIMADSAPISMTYIVLAMAYMSFCLSYLFPQFKENDERVKLIKQKGMFASFIAFMLYLILFQIGIQLGWVNLSALQLLHILSTLMICTVFSSFVIYSKKI